MLEMCAQLFIPLQHVSRDKHKIFRGDAAYYGTVLNGSPCISDDPVAANFTVDSPWRIHKYPRDINGEYVVRGISPTPPPGRRCVTFLWPLGRHYADWMAGLTRQTSSNFATSFPFKYPAVCSVFLIYSSTVQFVNSLCYAVLNMYMYAIIIIIILLLLQSSMLWSCVPWNSHKYFMYRGNISWRWRQDIRTKLC
jgi:hypothetical protein